jgi:hypothetical protein
MTHDEVLCRRIDASATARSEEMARQRGYRRRRRGPPSWGLLARPFEAGRAEAEQRRDLVRMVKWKKRLVDADTRLTAKELWRLFGKRGGD